jgi:hypothetical protein
MLIQTQILSASTEELIPAFHDQSHESSLIIPLEFSSGDIERHALCGIL